MDPEFDGYFRERLIALSAFPSNLRAVPDRFRDRLDEDPSQITLRALRQATARRGREVRGDAQLLLYLAFSELVARPMTAVRGPDPLRGRTVLELPDAITRDMELIVGSADEANDHQPISAHRIVNVTSQVWESLKSGSWGLWE